MRAVVTRPAEDAERIAAPLRARGVDVLIEPLLAVVQVAGAQVDTTGVQAFVLTSANGVRALARALTETVGSDAEAWHLPVMAVGDQTAIVARELGFTRIDAAGGDVASLAALIRDRLRPDAGALLHAAGSHVAGDLSGDLGRHGYEVRRVVLYEARTATAFSASFIDALREGSVDAVLLYSPRTAKTFATLAKDADLRDACKDVRAYCLSQAVAGALNDLPFAAICVAARPEQDALLAVFDDDNRPRLRAPAGAKGGGQDADEPKGVPSMSDRPETSGDKNPAQEEPGKKPAEGASSKAADSASSGKTKPGTPADKAQGKDKTKEKAETAESPKPWDTPKGGDTPKETAKPQTAKPDNAKSDGPQRAGGGGGRTAATVLGILVILVLLALVSLPWWRGALPDDMRTWADRMMPAAEVPAAVQADIAELRGTLGSVRGMVQSLDGRVGALENRVGQVESQAAPVAANGPPSPAVVRAVESLQQRIEQLETATAVPNLSDAVATAQTRIAELENSRAPASAVLSLAERVERMETSLRDAGTREERSLSFLMSVAQLREAVAAGRPFDTELRAARVTAPQDVDVAQAVQDFAPLAEQGVAPLVVLRQRLNQEAEAIIRAAARPDDGDGWWNRTVDRALSVVSVRRTDGDAMGDGTAAIVSRAERRMVEGNLAGAIGELGALQGAPAEAAAPWLRDARARLAADAALSELTAEALARLNAARQQATAGQEG